MNNLIKKQFYNTVFTHFFFIEDSEILEVDYRTEMCISLLPMYANTNIQVEIALAGVYQEVKMPGLRRQLL